MKKPNCDKRIKRRGFMRRILGLGGAFALLPLAQADSAKAATAAGVVYHLDDSARAIPAIRNIRNHHKAMPKLAIRVVTLAQGIDWLLEDAKDDRGNDYAALIDGLMFDNVSFAVCGNTLAARDIDADSVHFGVDIVDSGVAEIARLQLEQGYAYLKP